MYRNRRRDSNTHLSSVSTKSDPKRWRALLFIGVSLLVIALDNTILNVALPSISRDLGASASELQWIVDAYILVFAALLLTMGALGDRIGRKRVLQAGLIWFAIGSLAAAFAPTTEFLIGARAFLGVGGALIMPATLSIIMATFVGDKERSKAIALWAAIYGLGIGLGPVIGGWLLERFAWSAVFLINIPVVIVALVGGYFFINESRDSQARQADIPGVVLSILGLFALVYGLIEAGVAGWSDPKVLVAFAIATIILAVFAWWEKRSPNAMLPLDFFKNPSFSGANLALVMIMFSMYGVVFFLSQYFQSVLGYSALNAGLLIFPLALLITVGSIISARVTGRFGIKIAVVSGIAAAAIGLFLLSQVADVETTYVTLFPAMALFSIGLGLAMPAATDSVMGSIPVHKAGIGSAMNDTTRQLGGALGVAVLGTLMNKVYLSQITTLEGISELPAEAAVVIGSSIQGAHFVARSLAAAGADASARLITESANQAFVDGMTQAMLIGAGILGIAAAITLIILPSIVKRSGREALGTETAASAIGD